MPYTSTITLDAIADRIAAATRIVIATHTKPDGDAFGSVVAMAAALRALGKTTDAVFVPPVPANLKTLAGQELYRTFNEGLALPQGDLYLLLDTGAWSQVGPMKAALEPNLSRTIIIDHHLSGDVPAGAIYIDSGAAACCEIICELIDVLQHRLAGSVKLLSPVVTESLFVGLASDTGWFRFSNTHAHTHLMAARLLDAGVDHAELFRKLEQMERPEKLALMIRALDSLQWLAAGKVAVMTLRARDFSETGALLEETERFVDLPQTVADAQVVVLATETPREKGAGVSSDPPVTRLSFRSKPGPDAVDVSKLAGQFGGGGHARASGAKVGDTLDHVLEKLRVTISSWSGLA